MRPSTPIQRTIDDATNAVPRSRTGPRDRLSKRCHALPPGWIRSRAIVAGLGVALLTASLLPPLTPHATPAAASSLSLQPATPTATPMVVVPVIQDSPAFQATVLPSSSDPILQPTAGPGLSVAACTSPDFIFQGCPFAPLAGPEAERRLEERAIALVLDQYQLPATERQRVLRYARGEVRTALFEDIQEAFKTLSYERSPDQQLLVDLFTRLVRDLHIRALRAAKEEYNSWALDPCRYEPPPGFSYDVRSVCVGASQLFRPESPGLQAFVAYGAKRVYLEKATDPRTGAVFWASSKAAMLAYGAFAAGVAGVMGATIGSTLPATAVAAIFPFAVRETITTTGAIVTTATANTAAAGAAAFANIAAVLVATLSTIVIASRSLAAEVAIPDDLDQLITAAERYDLEWVMRTCNPPVMCASAGSADMRLALDQELFAVLMLITTPDYPGTEPAPAAQPGDPRFVVWATGDTEGTRVEWLRYRHDDGSARAVRLSGSWFVDKPDAASDSEARLTLSISYREGTGDNEPTWAVRRVGQEFLKVRTGMRPTLLDYPEPRLSRNRDFSITQPGGRTVLAQAVP